MIVYRICQTYPPKHDPIDGEGAVIYGGRWNSEGTKMVYTASSLALARCELARHVNLEDAPDGFRVYEIRIPNSNLHEVSPLPNDWSSDPEPASTRYLGDHLCADLNILAIKVPSTCSPNDYNYLLNPNSIHYDKVRVVESYDFIT